MSSRPPEENEVAIDPAKLDSYTQLAKSYELPNAVKLKLDADVQQANSIAIVVTLLAGAIIALTSILGGIDSDFEEPSNGWKAFRVIMWTAIICNVGEAFICILAIKMCSDLPLWALEREMYLLDQPEEDKAGRAVRRPSFNPRNVRDRYLLLESVGMPKLYRFVDRVVIVLLVVSSTFSFLTLFYWVLHTQTFYVRMITLIPFVIIILLVLIVFIISMGVGRQRF
ncbi:hypothetical protein M408DRAFT_27036 [Serendipita vermifera MAFF 305830]|uniref:Uncharacterized protein n=1 Tax=Serendipita vermifera MAFF 305830 TaxID=933852 RepID=A0A0C2X4U7_SERVB|nr:hypothetical protein M408DRAFT_27036 [Serendipita vermifera MAFF 305830]